MENMQKELMLFTHQKLMDFDMSMSAQPTLW